MIAHLNGILASKSSNEAVIDCKGVGYSVLISMNTYDRLPATGEELLLITQLITREDSMLLYGFYDQSEKEAFLMLTSVSGIGPKIALGILSSVNVGELKHYLAEGNLTALVKLPGIGKKTAERLHLELRDKILKLSDSDEYIGTQFANSDSFIKDEAVSALITLGYTKQASDKAVSKALKSLNPSDLNAENLIRVALKLAMS